MVAKMHRAKIYSNNLQELKPNSFPCLVLKILTASLSNYCQSSSSVLSITQLLQHREFCQLFWKVHYMKSWLV